MTRLADKLAQRTSRILLLPSSKRTYIELRNTYKSMLAFRVVENGVPATSTYYISEETGKELKKALTQGLKKQRIAKAEEEKNG